MSAQINFFIKKFKSISFSKIILFGGFLLSVGTKAQIGIGQPSEPVSSDCISKQDIKDIASHFSQFSNLTGADFCNDNSQTWHLLASMMFMKRTAFDSNMIKSKDELFTGKFASDWFQYFIGRINDIDVVNDCPKGVVAYVMAFGGKTMYVCPAALTDSFSSLDRASVFMHEARHIDGYPHITCTKGPRAGIQGACDKKISDTGSYAVTVETYAQLAKYAQGLSPALKSYAKSSAVVYADEAFENAVKVNRTEHLILLTEDLKFNVLNISNSTLTQLGSSPLAGRIFKRGQHMVLIPTDKTKNGRYVFARNEGEIPQSPGDMMTEYNALPAVQKAQLVDIHNGSQFTARIYKNNLKMTCDPKSPAVKDMAMPSGQVAASLIYPQGYDRAAKMTYLTSESGDIFEIGCQGTSGYLRTASLKFDQKYTRMYQVAGSTFGLNSNGEVRIVKAESSVPLSLNLGSKVIEISPFQSYEFFD